MDFFPPKVRKADLATLISNPTRLESRIAQANENQYIIDYLFASSPAQGGAVIYERDDHSPYLQREAQAIDAGAEFPKLNEEELLPQVARVQKYGGEVDLSFESIRRNDTAAYRKKVMQLANTVIRKTNIVAVDTLTADPDIPSYGAPVSWDNPDATPLEDLMAGQSIIDDADKGFQSNVALINPQDALLLRARKDVRDALPRETKELNPVLTRELSGLLDVEWIKSPYIKRGTVWIADRNNVGVVGDEEGGEKADTYDEKHRQVTVLQAWRTVVPVITDPYAAVKVTGIAPAGV